LRYSPISEHAKQNTPEQDAQHDDTLGQASQLFAFAGEIPLGYDGGLEDASVELGLGAFVTAGIRDVLCLAG